MRWQLPNKRASGNEPAPEQPVSRPVRVAWDFAQNCDLTSAINSYGDVISHKDPAVSSEAAYFLGILYLEHEDEDQALGALGEALRLEHPVYSPAAGLTIGRIRYVREDV